MAELHETKIGQKFIDITLPNLVKAIEELTKELKRFNDFNEEQILTEQGQLELSIKSMDDDDDWQDTYVD